jgi:hypothetical protein
VLCSASGFCVLFFGVVFVFIPLHLQMLKMENDCGDYVLISKMNEAAIGSRYDNSQSSLDLNGM